VGARGLRERGGEGRIAGKPQVVVGAQHHDLSPSDDPGRPANTRDLARNAEYSVALEREDPFFDVLGEVHASRSTLGHRFT
jgi:hypothetical protein